MRRLFLFLVVSVFLAVVPARAAISLVNTAVGDSGAVSSTTIASAAQTHTAGNLLVVLIRANSTGTTVSSVTDTAGDAFFQCTGALNQSAQVTDIWYAKNIIGNVSDIVTVTFSNSTTYRGVIVLQYSGASTVSPFEAGANGSNSGTSVTSGAFSPQVSGDVIVVLGNQGSGGGTWTAGTNYTLRANTGVNSDVEAEDRQGAPSGSQTASISYSALTGMDISVAAFSVLPAVVISPASPVVNRGATQAFTETNGDAGTWSCTGTDSTGAGTTCAGSIVAGTGVYTAPATVTAQQSNGGYQLLPNNHVFNTRIDSLPVNANNATWMAVVNVGPFWGYYSDSGGPVNYITPSTSATVPMTFLYTPTKNGNWKIPLFPDIHQENGYFGAIYGDGQDHHLLSMDTTTGTLWEQYQYTIALTTTSASVAGNIATLNFASSPSDAGYHAGEIVGISAFTAGDTYFNGTPTLLTVTATSVTFALVHANASAATNGLLASASCTGCTSASGYTYSYSDYPLSNSPTTDAAGMAITPLQLGMQEVERAVATGGTVNHAIRYTHSLGYECSCNIWPAQTFATDGGTVPFGARFRLKSSFDISGYSAIQQVLLKQLQQYGAFNVDGGQNWVASVEQNAWPKAYADAFTSFNPSSVGAANAIGPKFTITNSAITSNVATITATNTLVPGYMVEMTNGTNCGGAFNYNLYKVATATGSQFTFPITHADCASAPDTGTFVSSLTNYFEFVDESGMMVSSTSGETTANQEIVTFTRTADSTTKSVHVTPQGVVVTFPKDYLYIMAGTPAQQLPVLVNIGSVTWTMSPSVGTLTSGGLYTPPTTQAGKTTTTITATSTTNATVAAQLAVTVFPSAAIRILPSQVSPDYTDSLGNTWWAFTGTNLALQTLNIGCGSLSFTDSTLWNCVNGYNYKAPETRVEMLVPNGKYQIIFRLRTYTNPGVGLWKLSTQNTVFYTGDFASDAGGINIAYTRVAPIVAVTDNHLSFVVWNAGNTQGGGPISSVSIIPVGTILTPGMKVTPGMTIK